MDERKMSTQAAIVRVVKARKTVTHAALVSADEHTALGLAASRAQ